MKAQKTGAMHMSDMTLNIDWGFVKQKRNVIAMKAFKALRLHYRPLKMFFCNHFK